MSYKRYLRRSRAAQLTESWFEEGYDFEFFERISSTEFRRIRRFEPVDNRLARIFRRITRAADRYYGEEAFRWELKISRARTCMAASYSTGGILLNPKHARWETGLVAAILAHEAAHVVLSHHYRYFLLSEAMGEKHDRWRILEQSRADELEADAVGQRILKLAGYAPRHMADLWWRCYLEDGWDPSDQEVKEGTHPSHRKRSMAASWTEQVLSR